MSYNFTIAKCIIKMYEENKERKMRIMRNIAAVCLWGITGYMIWCLIEGYEGFGGGILVDLSAIR